MRSAVAIPEGIAEPYLTALRMAIDFIFDRQARPLAVLFSGSVAQGHGDPRSDLDIWIVVEGEHRQRVQRRFNGVPCELFFNPERRISRYFADEAMDGRASSIGLTLDGHVLYDTEGVADRLRELATVVREAGPTVPPEEIVLRKYFAVDTLDNARDVERRDPLMSSILAGVAVKAALQLAYILGGMWTPRDKDLVLRLGEVCPQAVEPVGAYQRDPSPDTAAVVLESILGTAEFFEWESNPDAG